MEKHFGDLHSYKYLDGSTNRYTELACSGDQNSVEAELKTREEDLDLSVLLIRKSAKIFLYGWQLIPVIRY